DPLEISWDPAGGHLAAAALHGVDAVVHLAGENIASRWTESRKRRIRESRAGGTALVARALAQLDTPPRVLVSASAVGYYGDRGDELLDESSGAGTGFLAAVCVDWEAATQPAAAMRLALGREMANETLLASQRVVPRRLASAGYAFRAPTIDGALASIIRPAPSTGR